jgi:hypothetical protein
MVPAFPPRVRFCFGVDGGIRPAVVHGPQHSDPRMHEEDPAFGRQLFRRIGFTEWPHENQTLTKFRG